MLQLNEKLENYILDHIDPMDDLLHELQRQTHLKIFHPRQLSGPVQGKMLEMLVHMMQPKRILEIGTFTGYSALCMAKALADDGELHTIEVNDEIEEFTQGYFDRSGLAHKIHFHVGDALEVIPQLSGSFDMVFMDANKANYLEYYKLIFDMIPSGGFILADNVLWDGKVVDDKIAEGDHFTKGILAFNSFIKDDKRVQKVIFPIRDGIFVIRKL